MNLFRRIFALATVATAAVGLASADTIIGNTASQAASTSSSYSLGLNLFDSSLGTLDSVTLYFSATVNVTSMVITSTDGSNTDVFDYQSTVNLVKNFANSATAADKYTGETIQTFDTGIGSALGNCSSNGASTVPANPTYGCSGITLAPTATTGNLGPYSLSNTNTSYGLTTGTGTLGTFGVVLTGTALANYEALGGGTFTLTGNTQGASGEDEQGSGTTNATFSQTSTTQFAAEVDYAYSTPSGTPEPGTMVLLGSALVGLGIIGKRRRRA